MGSSVSNVNGKPSGVGTPSAGRALMRYLGRKGQSVHKRAEGWHQITLLACRVLKTVSKDCAYPDMSLQAFVAGCTSATINHTLLCHTIPCPIMWAARCLHVQL